MSSVPLHYCYLRNPLNFAARERATGALFDDYLLVIVVVFFILLVLLIPGLAVALGFLERCHCALPTLG